METTAPAATEQDQKELSAATELFGMARIEAKLARAQRIEAALVAIITPLEKGWKVDDMEQRLSEARAALES